MMSESCPYDYATAVAPGLTNPAMAARNDVVATLGKGVVKRCNVYRNNVIRVGPQSPKTARKYCSARPRKLSPVRSNRKAADRGLPHRPWNRGFLLRPTRSPSQTAPVLSLVSAFADTRIVGKHSYGHPLGYIETRHASN